MVLLVIAAIIFALFSCGKKISRPEETVFENASVFVDGMVFWGPGGDSQEYGQLLENGGMELWAEEDTLGIGPPEGWINETGYLTSRREAGNVYSDSFSTKLTWTSPDDQVFISDPISVIADSVYTCSLYVYDNDKSGRVQLCFFWGNGSIYSGGYSDNAAEWHVLAAATYVPSGVNSVRVGVKLQDIIEGLSDTTYLQLNPPWDEDHGYSFNNPGKIIVGWDTYLYVCDTGNNRIIQMDAAGTVHSIYEVDHPIGITQDELLRLIVVNGTRDIYKIDTFPGRDGNSTISYSFDSEHYDMLNENDVFTDVSEIPGYIDKAYFVSVYDTLLDQTGKVFLFQNDPDTSMTDNQDTMLPPEFPIGGDDPEAPDTSHNPVVEYGTGVGFADHPNGLTAFGRSGSLYLLTTQDSSSFKTQLLHWYTNSYYHVQFFRPALLPGGGTDLYSDTLSLDPLAATVDESGNIYVVCKQDSLSGDESFGAYKFDPIGRLREAWGPFANAIDSEDNYNSAGTMGKMNFPRGIAYDYFGDRRTVYISDSGNNRILRFKLSTDIEN